jgi:hypothetical protein
MEGKHEDEKDEIVLNVLKSNHYNNVLNNVYSKAVEGEEMTQVSHSIRRCPAWACGCFLPAGLTICCTRVRKPSHSSLCLELNGGGRLGCRPGDSISSRNRGCVPASPTSESADSFNDNAAHAEFYVRY